MIISETRQFSDNSRVEIRELRTVPCILLFSSKHPLAEKKDLNIFDFKNDSFWVLNTEEFSLARQIYEPYCRSKGFIPRFVEMNDIESGLLDLQQGGYSISDSLTYVKDTPIFKYIPLDLTLTAGAIWKKDSSNKALKVFIEEIV
jgi:hypothetical protein